MLCCWKKQLDQPETPVVASETSAVANSDAIQNLVELQEVQEDTESKEDTEDTVPPKEAYVYDEEKLEPKEKTNSQMMDWTEQEQSNRATLEQEGQFAKMEQIKSRLVEANEVAETDHPPGDNGFDAVKDLVAKITRDVSVIGTVFNQLTEVRAVISEPNVEEQAVNEIHGDIVATMRGLLEFQEHIVTNLKILTSVSGVNFKPEFKAMLAALENAKRIKFVTFKMNNEEEDQQIRLAKNAIHIAAFYLRTPLSDFVCLEESSEQLSNK